MTASTTAAPDWVRIDGATFTMGGGPGRDENPAHVVELGAFRLARAPVTHAEYQRFVDATAHPPPPFSHEAHLSAPTMPAVGVSWHDAIAYCAWLAAAIAEPGVRLPTEAEWEHAALAGRAVRYPWGDDGTAGIVDYDERWRDGPEPVDAYPSRHPWGFVGLGENIHEWCADWYAVDYYARSPRIDPQGPNDGVRRSSRGGAWRHRVKISRCAARSSIPPTCRYNDYGFRAATSG